MLAVFMSKKLFVAHVLAALLLVACNASKEKPDHNLAPKWQFQSYQCAFGCDPLLDGVLRQRIGQVLDFNNPGSGFDLFAECNGVLDLNESSRESSEVLRQLNNTVQPSQQFTPENSGLVQANLRTAQAICRAADGESSTFWVVSLTESEMMVYFEGASFLRFKMVDGK